MLVGYFYNTQYRYPLPFQIEKFKNEPSSLMLVLNILTNPKVAILLAEGFEKAEAIIIYKVLCHFQIEVHLLACQNQIIASNYHKY